MPDIAQSELKPALEVARTAPTQRAPNGIRYGTCGQTELSPADLESMVQTVPRAIAAALYHKTYYFVPLTLGNSGESVAGEREFNQTDPSKVMIALEFTTDLSDQSVCHRNVNFDGAECVFISTRLMQDRFALAFEFYINLGHHFVDTVGVPASFSTQVWSQAEANVRGETSQDAWEQRTKATGQANLQPTESAPAARRQTRAVAAKRGRIVQNLDASVDGGVIDEKARTEYLEAAFADAIAIYLLSLTVDFDYSELREREYPLLAASALAERLQHVAQLFPPNAGQELSIRYRRRNS